MTSTRQPRIAIVTPGQLGSNPRVVKEAQALHSAGFDVTVIATKVADFVEARDQSILETAPYRVVRVSFMDRFARAVGRLEVAVARIGHRLTNSHLAAGTAHSMMTSRLAAAACAVPADLYIAHYVAALPAAAEAARRHGARYAFDAEDFHLGDLPERPEHAFEERLIHAIESRWLPGAAYVTAAAPLIADAYAEAYGIPRPTVVLNTFPRSNAPAAPTPKGVASPGPSVYWFSQTIGPGRGLETALDAIAIATTKPHLYLRGTPAAGYRERLVEQARSLGVADRLHFLEPIAPNELERAGAAYDVGFIGETGETRNRAIALTNKLFSYLTSGIPILASNIPAHAAIAPELDKVMTVYEVDDPHGLAWQLDTLVNDQVKLAEVRSHAWWLGQSAFSWEDQASILLGQVSATYRETVRRT